MYGQPANITKLLKIAKRYNLILIEDCAQAIGAKYKNKFVGTFGDLACFSFYQTKNITCGEGGMIITDNKKYADLIDSLLDNGLKKDDVEAYNYDKLGYNYRLTEIQAAIGIEQLKKLNKINKIRRRNAWIYQKKLKNLGILFQTESKRTENVYFYLTGLLPVEISHLRDEFIERVRKKGVPIKKLYPLSLHKIDLFKEKVQYRCPIAEDITKRLFNLYVNPGLTLKDISYFCKIIEKIYKSLIKE
jgi:perosamine synthetase